MDIHDDAGQWMSVAELAAKRRISEQSAARLVRRRKWQRRTDPDNVVRVLVETRTADTPNRPRGSQPAIEVLRLAVEALRDELARSHQREADLRAAVTRAELAASMAQERLGQMEAAERRGRWRWLWGR